MGKQTVFELICASQFLHNTTIELGDTDWDDIYREAVSQAVIGIVAPEVPDSVMTTDPRWKQEIYRQQANYVRYSYEEEELKHAMDAAGIPFVILKGNAAAIYYKHPERRKMGDIDFIVPQKEFDKAKRVLEQKGYEKVEKTKHPRHTTYRKNGIDFELHNRFSHDDIDIEDYVTEGLGNRDIGRIWGHEFPMLPKTPNGLVLLDHMRNHLKAGLGLRQIVDWMMYVNSELHDEDWTGGFEKVAREKGMWKFATIVTKMCQIYLGLPTDGITWCKDANETLCRRLMAIVMNSGNFGRKHGTGVKIENVSTTFHKEGVFHVLQKRGENNWVAYKKHRWLKPFCWIYQIFRYISRGLKTGRTGKKMNEDFKRSKERAEVLKKMGI